MEIVFYIGIVLLILFGPWILLWRVNSRRKSERVEDQSRWSDVTARVQALEQELRKLRTQTAAPDNRAVNTSAARAESGAPTSVAQPGPTIGTPALASAFKRPAAQPQAPPSAADAWVTSKPVPAQIPEPTPFQPSQPGATVPPLAAAAPKFASLETGPSRLDRLKSRSNLEETLGTDWLNKLGIAILVLGVAFFLAYQLKTLGPAGKVLVGLVTSGVLLAAGIWFERAERYRILARAGIGGGWALLFFTTYAMYHVPAAQVLSSQIVDLVLMLVVAAAMVAHTLRYRSQVVTGLAFLLAFLTVTISHSNVYSLSAGAVLAAGLVVIVARMQWFELEIFGMLASYFNHYLWLRPIIEPMHGHRRPFPEFAASAGILALYWLVFRMSYVFRLPKDERQEHISSAAALLNTALLLALFKYQSAHPEWAFWALLAIGAIETALGQLPVTRRRRSAVIVLSTLGVVLLVAAFPFRYSGTRLAVLWLVEAEALLLIGVWTKEVVFRRLGMLASVLVAGQMLSFDAAMIFGRRMDGADLRADFRLAIIFVVAAAVFYTNTHWIFRRWGDRFVTQFDRVFIQRLSFVGGVMLLVAAWLAFPESWTALAWCALGLGLSIATRYLHAPELRYQADAFAAFSIFRVLAINFDSGEKIHGLTVRLITVSAVAILLYVTARWNEGEGRESDARLLSIRTLPGPAYSWAASFLLALLAWYELRPVGVADAWIVGGVILLELGLARQRVHLRLQSYLLVAAAFLRIFFVNLNASGMPGEVSPGFYTVVPIGFAFFYAYWRLEQSRGELQIFEHRIRAAAVCCWLGTLTFASLMRFEMEADWVAAAWAALALGLIAIAWRSGRRVFLHQALLIIFGVLFRTVLHNFYQRSYFPAPVWESRWVTVGTTVAVLLIALPIAFQLRRKDAIDEVGLPRLLRSLAARPEQLFFFIAVGLLTVLLALEMRHGMVTLSWGLEGVAVFVLALWLGERSFRLTGLGLLLLCVAKIVVEDVWRLNPRDRYLTFIVLGAALLLVSFLYTRNREALRQYL